MTFDLQPKQTRAFLSRSTELLYGGAAGGGKSYLLRAASIAWAIDIPGLQIYLFRRTYPDLWKNHMEGPSSYPVLLAALIKAGVAKINYSDATIKFRNGSSILLSHCQYPKDVYNYQGPEIHVLMIDEITQWPEPMYQYLRGRVRMVGINIPDVYRAGKKGIDGRLNEWDLFPRVLVSGNPGGIGHNWVKASWVDKGEKLHKMPAKEGGMIRGYIPAKLEDNPALMEADPSYEERLNGLGSESLVRAMRSGDWDIVAGGALDDVWDRAIHVIKPFYIPTSWRIDRSFDWGSSKPFSVGWWAESDGTPVELAEGKSKTYPPGTLFRIGEWYGYTGRANEGLKLEDVKIGEGIKEREDKLIEAYNIKQRIQPGPADSSIFDADPGKDSIAKGIDIGYGQQGIFKMADKSSGSRVKGLEVVRRRLKAALEERLESPALFVFDTCTHGFIRTVPVLPRDERKPDDVDTKAEDHAYDDTRYRLTAPVYTAGGVKLGAV